MWIKNKDKKTKNKTWYVQNQRENNFFLCLTYVNMITKRTWQGYGVRSCFKLILNKLKKMMGPTFIYTLLGS